MVWKAIFARLKRESRKTASDPSQLENREVPAPIKNQGRPIQLVIGLDFGTSFSKVIVGESRVRYAVPFDDYALGGRSVLLPSVLSVAHDTGECRLGIDRRGGTMFDNLKMPLIERDFSENVQARAAAYLALVIRCSRNWLFDAHGSIYKGRNIEWFVNVGLPTDSFDDEQLTSVYLAIARTAWRVSVSPRVVTLQNVLAFLKKDATYRSQLHDEITELDLPHDRIQAFPEFSAQLSGYVRSPRRRDGLHVTVDVGGGTLDVAVFNVHERNGEDLFPIFARQVHPLGVRYLTTARLQPLCKEADQKHSPFDDLPPDDAFRERFGITTDQLENADQPFKNKVAGAIAEALDYTRQYRYPTAPQWDVSSSRYGEPLPGFFCGGGAKVDFYADILRGFEGKRPPFKLRGSQLPVPDDLQIPGMSPKDYARLSVAYGLSFDPFDIAQIKRMNEIDDVPAEVIQSTFEQRYIDNSQM